MRDVNRIPVIMEKMQRFWIRYPDLRLGQVMAIMNSRLSNTDNFYVEDEEWETMLNNLLKEKL